jgi:formate dehydrogenase iron-sulfur subunit
MTRTLPILGNDSGDGGLAGALARAAHDAVENFPNAFPPNRTPVPQPADAADRKRIMGFFTDTTLCIGCKACEVACKQWNQLPADGFNFTGYSYDNTKHLSATTWRHVTFKEKVGTDGDGNPDGSGAGGGVGAGVSRWLMMSDVCKHCESAPCEHSCPTGAIVYNNFGDVYVQNDICNGCGYCVSACPFGVLGRADAPEQDGRAHKCTLCMDRQAADMTPACAKACPTASIQFGPVDALREAARRRVGDLHERGNDRAYLYGADSVGEYGPLNSFFLLEDHPNEYNLPVNPPQPFRGQGLRYAAGLLTGAVLTALSFWAFGAGEGRGAGIRTGGRRRG